MRHAGVSSPFIVLLRFVGGGCLERVKTLDSLNKSAKIQGISILFQGSRSSEPHQCSVSIPRLMNPPRDVPSPESPSIELEIQQFLVMKNLL